MKRRNEELDVENAKLKKETDDLKGKLANKENTIRIKDDRINELEKKLGVDPIIVEETQVNPESTPPIQPEGFGDIDKTKRTIDTVVDVETGKEIHAKDFFSQPESAIFKMRTELQKAIYLRHPKYICKYCGQMVKISGRKTERGSQHSFHIFVIVMTVITRRQLEEPRERLSVRNIQNAMKVNAIKN